MKKIIFLSVVILLLTACSDGIEKGTKILMLKVDYMTSEFEGGHEQLISTKKSGNANEIPISVDYVSPGDFGNIALYYQPSKELIFDGSIIWMGCGEITYPRSFNDPDYYEKMNEKVKQPDTFQYINYEPESFGTDSSDYSKIWEAVSDLAIVSEYMKSNKKVGLFLYTPSVGVGDPYDWDWFVIMETDSN
jgi:hypothetical protein